nr:CAB/ELIP/HLIP superfamily protein [Phymatolithon calcareum]WEA76913.1 CAB/ELIP/HLIP superfamily protein [Phymatolithon calcareum]
MEQKIGMGDLLCYLLFLFFYLNF